MFPLPYTLYFFNVYFFALDYSICKILSVYTCWHKGIRKRKKNKKDHYYGFPLHAKIMHILREEVYERHVLPSMCEILIVK